MTHTSGNIAAQAVAACAAVFCFSSMLAASAAEPESFGFGRDATTTEISAWDIDVRPDGRGLPPGSGNVAAGEKIYAAKCAICHGKTGVEGPNDRLVVHSAAEPFPDSADPETFRHRTIGNYWPYATTVFDYIRRSMPQNMPGSLQADEVYSLTAFLLHRNHIVPADAQMDAKTLPEVRMPARDRFVPDDRLDYMEVH